VPIILGSDKTTVSIATGHTEYYPLYASAGIIHNSARRAHSGALTVIGFLAIPKGMTSASLSSAVISEYQLPQLIANFPEVLSFASSVSSYFIHR
jgi:Plavaka transposase